MITKIEISGYKSFEAFELELKPFTVIAGINAVGKSNLFDALRHLSSLVSNKTLRESFETQRGSLTDLFTTYPDGSIADREALAKTLILPRDQIDTHLNTNNPEAVTEPKQKLAHLKSLGKLRITTGYEETVAKNARFEVLEQLPSFQHFSSEVIRAFRVGQVKV